LGRCTRKESGSGTIYYFSVFTWPTSGKLVIPGIVTRVKSARLLANNTVIKTNAGSGGLTLFLPDKAPDEVATVIKVEVKK
jgi:alpha-L-fucosidase